MSNSTTDPVVHDLKCTSNFFEAVADGSKTFEARRNDRNFKVGDVLRIREFGNMEYTGREVRKRITYILHGALYGGWGVHDGFAILALGPEESGDALQAERDRGNETIEQRFAVMYRDFVKSMWLGGLETPMDLAVAQLGIAGESGEVCELVKKHLRGDCPLDREKMKKELGDLLFYVTWVADYCDLTLDAVMAGNVEKLQERQRRNGTLRGSGSDR